jgi:DNA-binding response OmpR family regulator
LLWYYPLEADMDKVIKILLVEDDHDDVDLLKEALNDSKVLYNMDVINDGGLVDHYISACVSLPDIVILDFNLPRVHGRDLLKLIKNTPSFKNIPVVILTTSSAQKDMDFAYKEGAHQFLIKPTTVKGINAIVSAILAAI